MLNEDTRKPERLLVFTATYNERQNVGVLLDGIWSTAAHAQVLVVDDNSPDGTGALLDQIAASDARLTVIHRPSKLGLGTAHHLAMLFAIRRGFDTLITMDADLSHDPKDILRLTAKLSNADFVIGSRYAKGGSSGYTGYRHFVSAGANTSARLLLRIPLHEFTTSYRAFRVSRLKAMDFTKMHNAGYSFFMESVYRLHQAGFRLAEIPISFQDRVAGESKIPKNEIFRGIAKLLHLSLSRLVRRRSGKPSLSFEESCSACGSDLMSALEPGGTRRQDAPDKSPGGSPPLRVKCLVCGTDQIPQH
jgi:dolichol-phosphate mannosyltransferase